MGHGQTTEPETERALARSALRRTSARLLVTFLGLVLASHGAVAKDDDDDDTPAARGNTPPNIYLDLNTTIATIPANTLALGIGHGPLLSRLSLSSPSAVGVSVNAPLTVDIDDRISLFAGVSGNATRPDNGSWTPFEVNGWLVGFQADLHQQNGGAFPTVTLQSTLSGPTTSGPLAVTSLDSNLEFNYALDADETRGWLAGVRYTSIMVDSSVASVDSPVTAYLGGYYQWPSNWKLSARAGMQHFGGVHVGATTPIKPFTQPILRLDLDRMDDNDNRLFGVSAQIAWTPTASYSLVLRTPLYAVRN
jgi:hypothetical protein